MGRPQDVSKPKFSLSSTVTCGSLLFLLLVFRLFHSNESEVASLLVFRIRVHRSRVCLRLNDQNLKPRAIHAHDELARRPPTPTAGVWACGRLHYSTEAIPIAARKAVRIMIVPPLWATCSRHFTRADPTWDGAAEQTH